MLRVVLLAFALVLCACSLDQPEHGVSPAPAPLPAAPAQVAASEPPATQPVPAPEVPVKAFSQPHRVVSRPARSIQLQEQANGDFAVLIRTLHEHPAQLLDTDENQMTLLHHLVRADQVAVVSSVLATLGPLPLADRWNRLPLHYAVSAPMTKLLWEQTVHGPGVRQTVVNAKEWRDRFGDIPLQLMARRGNAEAVRFAVTQLCHGPNSWRDYFYGNLLNSSDNLGRSPIHQATFANSPDTAEALAACASTKIDVRDHYQDSALHYAAALPDFKLGQLLLVHLQADSLLANALDAPDSEGRSAYAIATQCDRPEARAELWAAGARGTAPGSDAEERRCPELENRLFDPETGALNFETSLSPTARAPLF